MRIVLKPGERIEIVGTRTESVGEVLLIGGRLDCAAEVGNGRTAHLQHAFRIFVSCPNAAAGTAQPQQPKPPVAPDSFSELLYGNESEPITPMSERRVPRYEDQPSAGGRTYAHA